ncbi:MAG: hypothetical protein NVSMB13_00760 [Mycobacteriales bacterium]
MSSAAGRSSRPVRTRAVLLLALPLATAALSTACLRGVPGPGSGPVSEPVSGAGAAAEAAPAHPAIADAHSGAVPTLAPPPEVRTAPDPSFVVHRVKTTDPVVFITIDDGWVRQPQGQQLLLRQPVPATLFLANAAWRADRPYFQELARAGYPVADHTITHPVLPKLSAARQKAEICQAADDDEVEYGVRPVLFRPPYGATNPATLRAAADCGMTHVVLWSAAVNDGRVDIDGSPVLRPGDIVLMHFRATLYDDLTALMAKIAQAGLRPARLADYLTGPQRAPVVGAVVGRPPSP